MKRQDKKKLKLYAENYMSSISDMLGPSDGIIFADDLERREHETNHKRKTRIHK